MEGASGIADWLTDGARSATSSEAVLAGLLYGNIGGASGLDFTGIGPAVNLAARLEKLTGGLGRVILSSEEFAACCGGGFAPIGKFGLSGFSEARQVFGLADVAPPAPA